MTPADVLWVLAVEVPLPVPMLDRACEVLHVTKSDLKFARARYECPPPESTGSAPLVSIPSVVVASVPNTIGRETRAFVPLQRYTAAGAERAARRAFLSLRVEAIKCDLCGEWIRDDEIVVVDRCHHAHCDGVA